MNLPSYISGSIFIKANRILRNEVYACLDVYSLTATAWSLLGIVSSEHDGIRLTSVAKRLGVKAPLITMMADDLIERDLVKRIPHHTDGRAKLLVITPAGKRFVTKLEAELSKMLIKLLDGVSEQDLAGYQKVLETIITNGSVPNQN
jgi:MarR family transcriptional regulator, transcriptional regulator for hemolysin